VTGREPEAGREVPERLRALRDRLREDDRVLGAALLGSPGLGAHGVEWVCRPGGFIRLVIASTYDGRGKLVDELQALGALITDLAGARSVRDGARWIALTRDLTRLELEVVPLSELKPSGRGVGSIPLVDPQGVVGQWVRWSEGRPVETPDPDETATRAVLRLDDAHRHLEWLSPGAHQLVGRPAGIESRPLHHRIGNIVRDRAVFLTPPDGEVEAALADAIAGSLRSVPLPGEGVVVLPADGEAADDALERFYAIADAEGFRGDRPLFGRAAERLGELAGHGAAFEHGFCLATFDAVEARFGLDQPTGGCGLPLAPGVVVGVGVTPTDALEVWAAPSVRSATGSVACVLDDGAREVIARAAGKDALFEALDQAVDDAYARVPGLLTAAREAAERPVDDARAALRPLHLPLSHVEAALLAAGPAGASNSLALALALAQAAEDAAPLVARKLSFAAGRLL